MIQEFPDESYYESEAQYEPSDSQPYLQEYSRRSSLKPNSPPTQKSAKLKNHLNSKSDSITPAQSWITPYIDKHLDDISQIYYAIAPAGQDMIDADTLKKFIREILLLINMPQSKGDLFLFDRMIENRYKVLRNGVTSYMRISFYKCLDLIEEWARKDILNKQRFHRMLDDTISQFESLQKTASAYGELNSLV